MKRNSLSEVRIQGEITCLLKNKEVVKVILLVGLLPKVDSQEGQVSYIYTGDSNFPPVNGLQSLCKVIIDGHWAC